VLAVSAHGQRRPVPVVRQRVRDRDHHARCANRGNDTGGSSASLIWCGLLHKDPRRSGDQPGKERRAAAHLSDESTSKRQLRLGGGTRRWWPAEEATGCSSDGLGSFSETYCSLESKEVGWRRSHGICPQRLDNGGRWRRGVAPFQPSAMKVKGSNGFATPWRCSERKWRVSGSTTAANRRRAHMALFMAEMGETSNSTSPRPHGGERGHQQQKGVGTHHFCGLAGAGERWRWRSQTFSSGSNGEWPYAWLGALEKRKKGTLKAWLVQGIRELYVIMILLILGFTGLVF
jgi:hypothetical protein